MLMTIEKANNARNQRVRDFINGYRTFFTEALTNNRQSRPLAPAY